ncbi:hypothetical protein Caci_2676 [Catenulispora acidiphila DSM 44928]|uniref:Uncharacterized protein n=1 Tax=Catenulispora acidiphila (strain DSM 44928 / JCM 14897 / NBRC 102108 / NRRL B-24433 / ID139908) TaxID=479433 RepID=C7PZD5_CATAD|nr:hypothetical protein [Catenulispora acidiphila]ACU71592.1 hypothetical protein Caci_2676 [Catenulispora acidiphila DSM 44928]
MSAIDDEFQHVMDSYTRDTRAARKAVQADRDQQIAMLYPDARTFRLKQADAISDTEKGEKALALVPETLTLVTPDLRDPKRDHLFVGPHPVPSVGMTWNPVHRELSFLTSDGEHKISGHLSMTHNRLRAYGTVSVDGQSVAVEYHVDPQRYKMKVAKGAAYLAADRSITWDTTTDRWKNAEWSTDYELGFTYGINGEEVIGDEKLYTFLAKFDNPKTGRSWEPVPETYGGYLNKQRRINFGLLSDYKPPSGTGTELFPYRFSCTLSEFAADFTGGLVVDPPGSTNPLVYGAIGVWTGRGIAGLYHLGDAGHGAVRIVAVHAGRLYAGSVAAAHTEIDGDVLVWSGLDKVAADQAGIPTEGRLAFSPDGGRVLHSSFGATGERVHPDQALDLVSRIAVTGLAASLRHAVALANPGPGATHDLSELMAMSQFTRNEKDEYYDKVQEDSMEDFYKILQNYMDPELRSTFFHRDPPALDQTLRDIAKTKGKKGTDPFPWFKSLSVAYTATCVGKYSDDPAAKTLNTIRAEQWLSQTTSGSDVMDAQAPLLYANRWSERPANKHLGWYLADQKANSVKYAGDIDATTEAWLKEAREANVGTPEQLAELEKSIRTIGDHAKKHDQFWAFAVYIGASRPSYMNMLESFIKLGGEVDGSEFSQRVQRTVATLTVLDTSGVIAQEYAYMLQLFELSTLLPQMADLEGGVGGFNFAVKAIIDKFVEKYLGSKDPALDEAAKLLKEHASQDVVGKMLAILRTTAAVGYGLFNWGFLMAQYTSKCAQLLGSLPAMVVRLGALAAMGTLMSFFLDGTADWNSLSDEQIGFISLAGANILALNALALIKRGVALHEVWNPAKGFWKNAKMFFSSKLLAKAQATATNGLRGYLLQEGGPKVPAGRITFKQWWANRQAAAAAPLVPKPSQSFARRLFGKNLTQFMARALAGAFAIVGIVMSSIDLHHSGEPLEKAAHAMFLLAACLELVAVIGAWALGTSALAVGGMLVSTMFSIVSGIGFLALVAGAILLIVLMTRPQQTPVEKFAKERAGDLYMPYKAAIETFRIYKPIGEPQRAGIAVFATTDQSHALRIASDGKVTQAPFDATGHTAFYVSVDEFGRTQLGAPIVNTKGKPCLMSLAVDDAGAIAAQDYASDLPEPEPKLLWYADIQGEGTYQDTTPDVKELKSAPFKLRSVFFVDSKKEVRWLAADGASGWKTTTDAAEAATVRLEMVATKPTELAMTDVSWFTVAHDEVTGPGLQVPGSVPQEWSISPALPTGLEFDKAEGTISMRKGADIPAAPKQEYTLTVKNGVGSAATTFSLEVVEPSEEIMAAA